jgi:hypothetical protein
LAAEKEASMLADDLELKTACAQKLREKNVGFLPINPVPLAMQAGELEGCTFGRDWTGGVWLAKTKSM